MPICLPAKLKRTWGLELVWQGLKRFGFRDWVYGSGQGGSVQKHSAPRVGDVGFRSPGFRALHAKQGLQ